ncbi:hypothetical protein [Hydrogenophaga soli]
MSHPSRRPLVLRAASLASLTLLMTTASAWAAPADPVLHSPRVAGADAAHRVNGEIPPEVPVQDLRRADIRAQGREALLKRTLAVGDLSL